MSTRFASPDERCATGHVGEMRHAESREQRIGARALRSVGRVMAEDARAAEESRQHDVASRRVGGAGGEQVGSDDPEPLAQLEDVPPVAAEDAHRAACAGERIALARDRLDQRRLAAAVRAEDADVLAGVDREGDVVERGTAASDRDRGRR